MACSGSFALSGGVFHSTSHLSRVSHILDGHHWLALYRDVEGPQEQTIFRPLQIPLFLRLFLFKDIVALRGPEIISELFARLQQGCTRLAEQFGHIRPFTHRETNASHQFFRGLETQHPNRSEFRRGLPVCRAQSGRRMDCKARDTSTGLQYSMAFSQHGEFISDSAEYVCVADGVE